MPILDAHRNQFDTPPDDTTIWRFIDLPALIRLCKTRTLSFTRLDRYDATDPWEGARAVLPMETIRAIELERQTSLGLSTAAAHAEVERHLGDPDVLKRCCAVSCWYESSQESVAMWRIYTQHGGVGIVSSVGRLRNALAKAEPTIHIGRVGYVDLDRNGLSPQRPPAFFLKRDIFDFEREMRLALLIAPSACNSEGPLDEWRELPVELEQLIERLVVPPGAEPLLFGAVEILVRDLAHLDVPVVRSRIDGPRRSSSA